MNHEDLPHTTYLDLVEAIGFATVSMHLRLVDAGLIEPSAVPRHMRAVASNMQPDGQTAMRLVAEWLEKGAAPGARLAD